MEEKQKNKDKNKQKQYIILAVLIIIMIALAGVMFFMSQNSNEDELDENEMAYTDLITQINEGNVEKIEMTVGSTTVNVKLKDQEEFLVRKLLLK